MKINIFLRGRIRYPQLLLVAGVLLSWWLLDNESANLVPGSGEAPHRPDFWAAGFTTTALDIAGVPSYELTGRKMVHFRDDGSTEFDYPDYVRHRAEQGPVTITAKSGLNNEDGSQMLLVGDVVIVSAGNNQTGEVTAKMDELLLYPQDDFAETSSPVEIVTSTGVTTGIGMRVNSRTGTLILLSNVRGTYESSQ